MAFKKTPTETIRSPVRNFKIVSGDLVEALTAPLTREGSASRMEILVESLEGGLDDGDRCAK